MGRMHLKEEYVQALFIAVSEQRTRQYTTREDGAMDIEQGDTGSPNPGSSRLQDVEVVIAVVERQRKQ